MKSHWWSCVLGLVCMAAEVAHSTWTVLQSPASTHRAKVNSSAEIKCSTSSTEVMGLCLRRRFHSKRDIVFLSLNKGEVMKDTTATEFKGRIQVTPNRNVKQGIELTLQLSLLQLEDTDLYYCEWNSLDSQSMQESKSSNGTILIVREFDAHEECESKLLDHVLISLSAAALIFLLFFCIGTMILKCPRFKKRFRPARVITSNRPNRPQHVCPQRSNQHYPYWITTEDNLDYRDIL
ncbi:uncharacterized protein LOC114845315 [Betta splendens]|uniref:Uncharacterized protein LOC114845315 n=1 Tax=Betta splendens TaxID=158456 RepID=A0A6P7L4Y2_BETSP|nr:uncharacterized protein LOC114845315 [Betta splendens]